MLEYLKTFVISGALIAGAKYISQRVNPAMAPVVAGFPIGIIGSLFIYPENAKRRYYAGFMYSSMILATCVSKIYIASLIFPEIPVDKLTIIGMLAWGLLSWFTIRFLLIQKS